MPSGPDKRPTFGAEDVLFSPPGRAENEIPIVVKEQPPIEKSQISPASKNKGKLASDTRFEKAPAEGKRV